MIIKNLDLDSLDRYQFLSLINIIVEYYFIQYCIRLIITEEKKMLDNIKI